VDIWPGLGWKDSKGKETQSRIVEIMKGQILMVPGRCVHGGGFMADKSGDLRGHLYAYPDKQIVQMKREMNVDVDTEVSDVQFTVNPYLHNQDYPRKPSDYFSDSSGRGSGQLAVGGGSAKKKIGRVDGKDWQLGGRFFGVQYDEQGMFLGPGTPTVNKIRRDAAIGIGAFFVEDCCICSL
jgi:hypothetical protein